MIDGGYNVVWHKGNNPTISFSIIEVNFFLNFKELQ